MTSTPDIGQIKASEDWRIYSNLEGDPHERMAAAYLSVAYFGPPGFGVPRPGPRPDTGHREHLEEALHEIQRGKGRS